MGLDDQNNRGEENTKQNKMRDKKRQTETKQVKGSDDKREQKRRNKLL